MKPEPGCGSLCLWVLTLGVARIAKHTLYPSAVTNTMTNRARLLFNNVHQRSRIHGPIVVKLLFVQIPWADERSTFPCIFRRQNCIHKQTLTQVNQCSPLFSFFPPLSLFLSSSLIFPHKWFFFYLRLHTIEKKSPINTWLMKELGFFCGVLFSLRLFYFSLGCSYLKFPPSNLENVYFALFGRARRAFKTLNDRFPFFVWEQIMYVCVCLCVWARGRGGYWSSACLCVCVCMWR